MLNLAIFILGEQDHDCLESFVALSPTPPTFSANIFPLQAANSHLLLENSNK